MAEDRRNPDPGSTNARELEVDRGSRGGEPGHTEEPNGADPRSGRDRTEGRDRAPSDRGRDPDGPWLGGG